VVIVEPELRSHPKFRRLKRRLGAGAMDVLIALWGHCQENKRGEFWAGADAEYVADVCEWTGDVATLFDALTESVNGRPGWIEVQNGGVSIHDWGQKNAQLIHNWKVGQMGGRPKKENPVDNPDSTEENPRVNPVDNPDPSTSKPKGKPIDRRIDRKRERTRARKVATPVAGDPEEKTVPPTVGEVEAFGAELRDPIPEGFCRQYHNRKCIKKRAWFYKGGLIDWQRELQTFWVEDRADWEKKAAGATNGTATVEELTAAFEQERDPARREALRRQIKQLEAAA
jgi:hypothetical protein